MQYVYVATTCSVECAYERWVTIKSVYMREKAVDAIKQYENVILSTNIAFN